MVVVWMVDTGLAAAVMAQEVMAQKEGGLLEQAVADKGKVMAMTLVWGKVIVEKAVVTKAVDVAVQVVVAVQRRVAL